MGMIIQTKNVVKSFPVPEGEFIALKDISIDVPKNKLTILRGRSGSGKTTLMNILGGLDYPKSGEVLFKKQNIASLSEHMRERIRKEKIGFIFQSVALIPMMNAYENVEFALRLAGWKGNKKERTMKCLEMVGLGRRVKHMPHELSGGEQQRVAIARAIAHSPEVIFADEPTAELDTNTGIQVVRIFRNLVENEGVTIVMTTHDTGLMEAAECIYELEDGRIVEKFEK